MEKEQKILELKKQLFEQLIKDIIDLVSPFGSLKIRSVHRFVDDDLCVDIVRTKEVKVKNGQLLLLQDTWNGEGDASETYFDDDESFHEEYWANYSTLSPVTYAFTVGDLFMIELLASIYQGVVNAIEKSPD